MNTIKTIREYQNDVYKRDSEAIIKETFKIDKIIEIVLNCTIFFPEGGGQPSDTGFINDFPVFHVREEEGIVYHQIREADLSEDQMKKIMSLSPD